MKEIEEIIERMNGTDELVDSVIKKVSELEKRKVLIPDYTPFFEGLQKIMVQWQSDQYNGQADLKKLLENIAISEAIGQLNQTVSDAKEIVSQTKKLLPVKHEHHFDLKTKTWIMSGILLLLVTALTTSFAINYWMLNNKLKADNIKYRMIKQIYPEVGLWADTTYLNNPDNFVQITEKLENGQINSKQSTEKKHIKNPKRVLNDSNFDKNHK